MNMVLALPVMDAHEWTQKTVASILKTARGKNFTLVIVDNNSVEPYRAAEFGETPDNVTLLVQRNEKNLGYYSPLKDMYDAFSATHIYMGLIHNDLTLYEEGWDLRMVEAFEHDPLLALIGLAGSYQIDSAGGRGSGTMLWFRGQDAEGNVTGQPQSAGLRITDLRPAACLDSLFMMFRASDIPLLRWDDKPTLAHFYDKIWPCRLIQKGKRVAVLGSECDHWGGITLITNPRFEESCRIWCEENGVKPYTEESNNWGLAVYKEAERRFENEFLNKLYPFSVDGGYNVNRWR